MTTGLLFVYPASGALLDQDKVTNDAREVMALQRYLRKVNGDFGN